MRWLSAVLLRDQLRDKLVEVRGERITFHCLVISETDREFSGGFGHDVVIAASVLPDDNVLLRPWFAEVTIGTDGPVCINDQLWIVKQPKVWGFRVRQRRRVVRYNVDVWSRQWKTKREFDGGYLVSCHSASSSVG
jgi:hypothetical protein